MRITSKGQLTIPRGVREKLGLRPHTEVEFVVEGSARGQSSIGIKAEAVHMCAARSSAGLFQAFGNPGLDH